MTPPAGEQRKFLIRFVALALLSGMALSPSLWRSDRRFPASHLIDWGFSPAIIGALSLAAFAFVALQAITADRRITFLNLPLFAILIAADLNRLQPWLYDYLLFLIFLGLSGTGESSLLSARRALQLSIIGIYLWSGFQKLNISYLARIPLWLGEPFADSPEIIRNCIAFLVVVGPALEIAMALMLLFPSSRKRGVIFCVAAHLFVLLTLGPFGRAANSVIWPWNIAMAGLVFYLFFHDTETTPRSLLKPATLVHRLAFALFLIAPAGSFIGVWNPYLSSALYSANAYNARVKASPAALQRMGSELENLFEIDHGAPMMVLNSWALKELNVPIFPTRENMLSTARYLCRYAQQRDDIEIWLYAPPPAWRIAAPEITQCGL